MPRRAQGQIRSAGSGRDPVRDRGPRSRPARGGTGVPRASRSSIPIGRSASPDCSQPSARDPQLEMDPDRRGRIMTAAKSELPEVYLARHGETEWTITGQHTGTTEIPLTPRGERNARRLGDRLAGVSFDRILTSPRERASKTCVLAGFGDRAEVEPD